MTCSHVQAQVLQNEETQLFSSFLANIAHTLADLECEEDVLGETAKRATDLPSRIWAYEQLIHEVSTPSAMALIRYVLDFGKEWDCL